MLEVITFEEGVAPVVGFDYIPTDEDQEYMQRALWLAGRASSQGNNPIGFVLVGPDKTIYESESREFSENDLLGHAEHLSYRKAQPDLGLDLSKAVGYGSVSPCIGCAYMLNKGGIGLLHFALEYAETNSFFRNTELTWRDVFGTSRRNLRVVKGLMADEARELYVPERRVHDRH